MLTPKQKATLEALNSDHHVRMSANHDARNPDQDRVNRELNQSSRDVVIRAIKGCRNRHHMQSPWMDDRPRVLDLGSGYSGEKDHLELAFKGEHFDRAEYFGIEVVERVAAAARERYPETMILNMPLEDAPEEWNGKFDFVYSRHVLEHTPDPLLAIRTIKRLLAPHGICGNVTPHYFPDPEAAHISQLKMEEWIEVYGQAGMKVAYAAVFRFSCEEAHIVAVHESWPFSI